MEYLDALESGSSPKIEKAARHIFKKELAGYCPHLLRSLEAQTKKAKAWKSQSELIKAIGVTGCEQALPLLRSLIEEEPVATVLYRHLAFAIVLLENTSKLNLDFVYSSIEKGNSLQIGGACSALLYKKIIPNNEAIRKIISGVSPFIENEGQVTSPRTYIAALAYLWPPEETKKFLEDCRMSNSSVLLEIVETSLKGEKSRHTLNTA